MMKRTKLAFTSFVLFLFKKEYENPLNLQCVYIDLQIVKTKLILQSYSYLVNKTSILRG